MKLWFLHKAESSDVEDTSIFAFDNSITKEQIEKAIKDAHKHYEDEDTTGIYKKCIYECDFVLEALENLGGTEQELYGPIYW